MRTAVPRALNGSKKSVFPNLGRDAPKKDNCGVLRQSPSQSSWQVASLSEEEPRPNARPRAKAAPGGKLTPTFSIAIDRARPVHSGRRGARDRLRELAAFGTKLKGSFKTQALIGIPLTLQSSP